MKQPYRSPVKKSKLLDHIVVITCLGLFVLPVLYLIYFSVLRLRIEAWQNARYLSGVTIVQGQKTQATARPNGDALTGSSSPAYAEFNVNDSLGNLYVQTSGNMKAQGYATDGYADMSDATPGIRKVAVKFTKETKSLVLEYNFKDRFECSAANGYPKPCIIGDSYVDVAGTGLQDRQVTKLKAFYDNN